MTDLQTTARCGDARAVDNPTPIWCSLVMIDELYAAGVCAAAASARAVNTQYPFWCMVTPEIGDKTVAALARWCDRVVRVPLIAAECIPMKSAKQRQIYGGWISRSFTKANIFNPALFPGVNKIIFVDADMIFKRNCDELFNLPAPALTFATPWNTIAPQARANQRGRERGRGRGRFGRNITTQQHNDPYSNPAHGAAVSLADIKRGLDSAYVGCANMILVAPNADLYMSALLVIGGAGATIDGRRAHLGKYEFMGHVQEWYSELRQPYGHPRCQSGFDEQLIADVLIATGTVPRHIHQRFNWYIGKKEWLRVGGANAGGADADNAPADNTPQYYEPYTWQWYNTKPWREDPAGANAQQYADIGVWWELFRSLAAQCAHTRALLDKCVATHDNAFAALHG